QRGVVQNEKRQGDNQPYSIAEELTVKSTYPAGHPYSWSVIGSMEDLDAASLTDVKDWFKTYYGPNNAVICIAGDINAEEAFEKVKKYFGDLPAGPPIAKHSAWIAKMTGIHEQIAEDRVPQARIQKTWNIPGWGTKEMTHLNLFGSVLTTGKTSRLYKRLVYDDQLASNVFFYTDEKEIGGQFVIIADAKPGVDLSKINSVIDEELKKLFTQGITVAELERAKTGYFASLIKGIERIGGFGGKSDILAQNECFGGDAGYFKKVSEMVKKATIADIKNVANDWLTDGQYILKILPYGSFTTSAAILNRNEQPPLGTAPVIKFPEVNSFNLSNGLKVSLVERKSVPVVNLTLMVNAGYAADQFSLSGVASMQGTMLTEGTKTKTSLQISDQLENLGATLTSYSNLDNSYLQLNALKSNFDASMDLFADVLLNPSFPQKDFERVKKDRLLTIKQEQSQPVTMGLRILPKLLYGEGHAYNSPFTGSGTEDAVNKITRDDLVKFHQTWFTPNNSNLVVVGDISAAGLKLKLESSLASWKTKDVPAKNIREVALPASPRVYIIDKPGATQSIIFAAEVSPSAMDPDNEAIQMASLIIGGEFTSRLNMNLREGKHWSYGAFTFAIDAKGPGFFSGYAPVQTDKTKESIVEMLNELKQYVLDKPATEAEFKKTQGNAVLQLPGNWETNKAVSASLQSAITYDRGVKYLNNYASMLRNLSLASIQQAAVKVIKPANLTWVIVGDRAVIEKGIQELNIGPIKYIDSEGNAVK
ncbi:MAG: pitrilysin family protein, partial [Ferruginibacter sp.]